MCFVLRLQFASFVLSVMYGGRFVFDHYCLNSFMFQRCGGVVVYSLENTVVKLATCSLLNSLLL